MLLVCLAAFVLCGWSLLLPTRPWLFGSETIRVRLRLPHVLVMFGSLASAGMVFAKRIDIPPHGIPTESAFLSLATVLVLFMLFGFVAFEAGTGLSQVRHNGVLRVDRV